MDRSYLREIRDQAREDCEKFKGRYEYYPSTKSTLGMLMIGEIAASRKEYDRAYQSYGEALRRVMLRERGVEQLEDCFETTTEKYKAFTRTRLERLVKQIHEDPCSPEHSYMFKHSGDVEEFAQYLIDELDEKR
jgi:hypothetical protein